MKIHPVLALLALLISTTDISAASPPSSEPQLVLQYGVGQANHAAVANEGRWIVLPGQDGLDVFDGRAGLRWGTWRGVTYEWPCMFSPDGDKLLLQYVDPQGIQNKTVLRAVPSGRLEHTFAIGTPLQFDGKHVCGVEAGALLTLDTTANRVVGKVKLAHPATGDAANNYALSGNGRYLTNSGSGVYQPTARLWDARTGALLRTITGNRNVLGKAAASPDGRWLATEGENPDWQPPSGDNPGTEASYSRELTIKLWSVATGKLVHIWQGQYALDGGAQTLCFSSDGKQLVSAGLARFDVWNVSDYTLRLRLEDNGTAGPRIQGPFALSPDQRTIAANRQALPRDRGTSGLCLVDVFSGQVRQSFGSGLIGTQRVSWSPDGEYLAGSGGLDIWDAQSGHLLASNDDLPVSDLAWQDAATVQTDRLQAVDFWQAPTATLLREVQVPKRVSSKTSVLDDYHGGYSVAPDGKTLLTGPLKMGSRSLLVWDTDSGQLRREIPDMDAHFSMPNHLWLPDSKHILHSTPAGMQLWNLESGQMEREWHDPVDPKYRASDFSLALMPLAVSRSGRWAAVLADRNKALLIYDMDSGALHSTILSRSGFFGTQFSSDEKLLWVPGVAGLEAWSVDGLTEHSVDFIPGAQGTTFAFSPDARLVALTTGGGIEIWNVQQRSKVLTLYRASGIRAPNPEWIALTPSGDYDASPVAETHLRWRDVTGFWSVTKSHEQFFKPKFVKRALAAE